MSVPYGDQPVTGAPKTKDELRLEKYLLFRGRAEHAATEAVTAVDPMAALAYSSAAQACAAVAALYWAELYG